MLIPRFSIIKNLVEKQSSIYITVYHMLYNVRRNKIPTVKFHILSQFAHPCDSIQSSQLFHVQPTVYGTVFPRTQS